jgi:hypothetical protein
MVLCDFDAARGLSGEKTVRFAGGNGSEDGHYVHGASSDTVLAGADAGRSCAQEVRAQLGLAA